MYLDAIGTANTVWWLYKYRKFHYNVGKRIYNYLPRPRSNMPYLRGTAKKTLVVKPQTLQNQINQLKRRVRQNTPATVHFRTNPPAFTSGGTGWAQLTYSFTSAFVTSPVFRDDINGDWFRNLWLDLSFAIHPAMDRFRFILYSPRKAGTFYTPGATITGFCAHPDSSMYHVYHDEMINFDADPKAALRRISLRNLKTCIDNTTIQQGELMLTIIYQGTTATSTDWAYNLHVKDMN